MEKNNEFGISLLGRISIFVVIILFGVFMFYVYKSDRVHIEKGEEQIPTELLYKLPNGSIDPDECHQNLYSLPNHTSQTIHLKSR